MKHLICTLFGHKETMFNFGTSDSGCQIARCSRCSGARVHSKWNVPEMEEWPMVVLTPDEMREFVTEMNKHV